MAKRKKKSAAISNTLVIAILAVMLIIAAGAAVKYGFANSLFSAIAPPSSTSSNTNSTQPSYKLSGNVADYFSRSIIQGANVYISVPSTNEFYVATTDTSGDFQIEAQILVGTQIIVEIVKSGYLVYEGTKIVKDPGNDNTQYSFIGQFMLIPKSAVTLSFQNINDTSITSWNYTSLGTSMTLTVRLRLTEDMHGWGDAYDDISSWNASDPENIYVGGIILLSVDTSHALVTNAGGFQLVRSVGTVAYYSLNVGQIIRNTAANQDGKASTDVVFSISSAGTAAISAQAFSHISEADLNNVNLVGLTADASVSLNIVS